jgi:hypothetical protein
MRLWSHRSSRRRAARLIAAGAVIGIGHLGLLLILSVTGSRVAPGPKVEPAHVDFAVRLEPPKPAKPAPPPRRVRRHESPPRVEAVHPTPGPPPPARVAVTPAAPQSLPSPPNYGRWTVAPGAASAQAPAPGLPGCTPATLPTLTGAARDACAKRLVETAKNAPVLPPTGYQPNVEAQAYAQAVKAWKTSPAMTSHPCPPQDEPAHKLYLDKCSLVNAARSADGRHGSSPGVKIEFKYKF